ncbi:MAG: prolipoprotein diacylglyceryl transferase, partial [Bacteroidota bacterium]|nr:prolipoprotein diacylglyceryl transferase [Bacteroidota bacterium]
MLSYILWNPNEIMFHIGSFGIRWYSMCWLLGLLLAYFLMQRLFKEQKIPQEKFDPLFIYIFLSILIGARLGHCLFYQPD